MSLIVDMIGCGRKKEQSTGVPSSPKPIYYRCSCGALIGEGGVSSGDHAGHRMRYATGGTIIEWIWISLGLVK